MSFPLVPGTFVLSLLASSAVAASRSEDPPPGADRAGRSMAGRELWLETWRALHGAGWRLADDPESGEPAMLFGGSAVLGPPVGGEADCLAIAEQALAEVEPLIGVSAATLVHDRTRFLPLGQAGSSDKWTLRFRQRIGGRPVEDASVHVLLDASGRLLAIQSTALLRTSGITAAPAIDAADAEVRARSLFDARFGREPDHARAPELVIRREPDPRGGRRGRLVWSVALAATDGEGEPDGRTFAIDASTGELAGEAPNIHSFDVHGRVVAMATPGVMPDTASNPEVVIPMCHLSVVTPLGTARTGEDGSFVIEGVDVAVPARLRFRGAFTDVTSEGSLGTYSQEVVLRPNTPNLVVMNHLMHVQHTAAANVFHVIDEMRDWVRSIDPADDAADFVATAVVNHFGGCNAFYIGDTMIRFDRLGTNGCVNMAYSTIVAHEHGHWLADRYGNGNPLNGIGEANADIFAMYLWDRPVVGDGGGGPVPPPRTGTNTRQFCGDCCIGCFGEPHFDGLPWMGAAWKIRARLDLSHGDALGDLVADSLFLAWMRAFDQPQIDSSIEPQWLLLDDDDGDLSNGTPHYCDIECGFREQGFPGVPLLPGCCP